MALSNEDSKKVLSKRGGRRVPSRRRSQWGFLLPLFLLAPLGLGAKGCDAAVVGDDCPPDNTNPLCTANGDAGSGNTPDDRCGGLQGLACERGEFCNYSLDAQCGAADRTGTCEPIPMACDLIYAPVCGCDDKTYGNSCAAALAGVSVAANGECAPSGSACGGLQGLACDRDEYCAYPVEAACGQGDQTGVCRPMPEACEDVYKPVCGCDGETYGNRCEAAGAGVSVASEGACQDPGSGDACGGLLGLSCEPGQYCNYAPDAGCGFADQTGVCTPVPTTGCREIYQPVCGCNGRTYGNECEAASAGISVASQGECREPGGGELCGGLQGVACSRGEYCYYPAETQCGAGDRTGLCTPTPGACDAIYQPVCGCDEKTYGNECEAARAGVSVATKGECAQDPGGVACGARLGTEVCGAGEYCNYPESATCGWADATGVCAEIPRGCTKESNPVCGCDGNTYGNPCMAAAAGVSVLHGGQCEPSGGMCGGIAGVACEKGEFCDFPIGANCGAADQMGTCRLPPEVCTDEYAPVCGCDGKTYGNRCAAASAGVSMVAEGACTEQP